VLEMFVQCPQKKECGKQENMLQWAMWDCAQSNYRR